MSQVVPSDLEKDFGDTGAIFFSPALKTTLTGFLIVQSILVICFSTSFLKSNSLVEPITLYFL
jgi:hypothetical protein